jgi:glutaminyl-tRNA synthetase
VRLRAAYFITCQEVVKDNAGEIVELRCTYDPLSRGGSAPDGRSPKATLHWVSAAHAVTGEVRIYNHLFSRPDPGALVDLLEGLNPQSEEVVSGCRLEGSLAGLPAGTLVQFERLGYFCVDRDTTEAMPVFNRTVTLRDAWAKVQAKVKP